MQDQHTLGERGRALWDELHADLEFDAHESRLLLEACRTLDTITALTGAVESAGVMIEGSTGQPVVHPGIAEIRQQQATFARLIAMLNLGESASGIVSAVSAAAASAANARWAKHREAKRATA